MKKPCIAAGLSFNFGQVQLTVRSSDYFVYDFLGSVGQFSTGRNGHGVADHADKIRNSNSTYNWPLPLLDLQYFLAYCRIPQGL
jgi:hypothetical protein